MPTREFVFNTLKSNKEIMLRFGMKEIGIFGSYARDEQSENSDIDILVDFEPGKENFDNYMALYDFLEKLFINQRIEIVTKNGLSQYIGPTILNEVYYV